MDDQITSHLTRFVSFRTVDGENDAKGECLDWITETFLKDCELSLQRDDFEGAPYLIGNHDDPQLILFAHIDVVPAEDHQFEVQREDDKLYGRGVTDMKGAILPYLMAYADLCGEGKEPPVTLLLTSDEETAGHTIPHLLKGKKVQGDIAYTPDSGPNPRIVVEHKGIIWADLISKGKGAHAAYPWRGENPLLLLADALKKIEEAFPKGEHEDWQMTVTPTKLQGSKAQNQIPDAATCGIDIRYPPQSYSDPEEACEAIRKVLPEGCELSVTLTADPLKTDPDHEMVLRMKRIIEEVEERDIDVGREHGGTDARYFSAAGIPAFLYGPTGEGIHGSNEWVSLTSLTNHYDIAKKLFLELSQA